MTDNTKILECDLALSEKPLLEVHKTLLDLEWELAISEHNLVKLKNGREMTREDINTLLVAVSSML